MAPPLVPAAGSAYERRLARLQAAGFQTERQYRQSLGTGKVAAALGAANLAANDPARYHVAALAAGMAEMPGRKGSKVRAEYIAWIARKIERRGGNVAAFFAAIGSPKRKGRK